MAHQTLRVRRERAALVVELHRPERMNALSLELLGELEAELDRVDTDPDVRVVVLTGSEKAFSTGVDLNEVVEATQIGDSLRFLARLRRATTTIETLSKPVVAAIRGFCLTGGLELALACDLRFAGSDARFGITSAKIGSVAGMGGTQRLPRLIGGSRAKDMLLTGRFLEAEEALAAGLVDRVVPPERVLEEAVGWADLCAEQAPLAVWLAKYGVNVGANVDLGSALDLESLLTTLAFGTQDREEGVRAFLEKRKASFTGR